MSYLTRHLVLAIVVEVLAVLAVLLFIAVLV